MKSGEKVECSFKFLLANLFVVILLLVKILESWVM